MKTLTQACQPDLSSRPFQLSVERVMGLPRETIYAAWTEKFDAWFASPGALAMNAEVGAPFFFEVQHGGQRHPHYGRFLSLIPHRLIELTWLTGAAGTKGAETVITVELSEREGATQVRLSHAGFPDQESCDRHAQAWPQILEHLERAFS